MPVITIEIDERSAAEDFADRVGSVSLRPLYASIGEYMLLETDDRFVREEAPDGTPWEPLSPATLAAKTTEKILQEKGTRAGLRGRINYQAGEDGVAVGTNLIYADVHQYGIDEEVNVPAHTRRITQAFGRELEEPVEVEVSAHTRQMTVPARPYLGMSSENEEVIAGMIQDFIRREL